MATISLVGDIALFGAFSLENNKSLLDGLFKVKEILSQSDYVIGNLETPFSQKEKKYGAKSAYIFSKPQNIEVLKYLSVNAVSLANNHIFDYGIEGYELTKKVLEENNIDYFGGEGKENDLYLEDNKIRIFGFCCYSSNPLKCVKYGDYGVNAFDIALVSERLEKAKRENFFSILSVHSGTEHVNFPSSDLVKVARGLGKEYDYLLYGHHPHVSQGIEQVNNSLIAYSLGNFCFDDVYTSNSKKPLVALSDNNRKSFILQVEIKNNKIIAYKIIPIFIESGKIIVGKGTTEEDIKEYGKIDLSNEIAYNLRRSQYINKYINERKKRRDFKWYLKRLRLRYVKIILNSKKNQKKYLLAVKKHIENENINS